MPVLGPGVRWLVFGVRADPDALRLTAAMIGAARLSAIGGFRPSVGNHSRVDVLSTLAGAHVTVIVGTHDRLTPRRCAQTIADAIDHAEQLVLDDAGHMLPLERPDAVTEAVAQLCRRVIAGTPARSSAA
jgi:pimeloyl-ACP methyl ester carboxylesterase